MLFALPGYQFPYTIMNRCLYLRTFSFVLYIYALVFFDKRKTIYFEGVCQYESEMYGWMCMSKNKLVGEHVCKNIEIDGYICT
jgi:hypothetical protein